MIFYTLPSGLLFAMLAGAVLLLALLPRPTRQQRRTDAQPAPYRSDRTPTRRTHR